MTGADKAAILLLYLGNDVTRQVFEHLDDAEIKKISKSMAPLDVEKAQSKIIKIVRTMEEEGKIVLAGRGGDDVLV